MDDVSQTGETVSLPIKAEVDIVAARARAKTIAQDMGFGLVDQTRIATAVSELTRNVIVHAAQGIVEMKCMVCGPSGRKGLEIVVSDQGPGIADINKALRGGYTSVGGLGMGLCGTKKLVDEFDIESAVGKGTKVCVRKWL